ncbi:MAG: protease modulator HflK [Treponema sp.]|jgi:membrane protease subunit HflK|nr:protease modulator HflK [Treponema sp.]
MKNRLFIVFTQIMEYIIKYFKLTVCFAAVLIALSGVYRVESSQIAVVLRFGKLTGGSPEKQIKRPGLQFALPFFIDKVIKIPVSTVQEIEITTHYKPGGSVASSDVEKNGYILTGDKNIVLVKAKIKYQINDPVCYTLFINDADKMLDGIISGELTCIASHSDVDSILTSGRARLSLDVMQNSQAIIDKLKLGVLISGVELTEITAPAETIRYFEEVRNAAIYKATSLQRAQEYASNMILGAQSSASLLKQTAVSGQSAKLIKARSEMAEFNGLYDQYARNPQIIMSGTFRQRVGAVLKKAGKSIVIPADSEPPTFLLP